MACDQLLEMDTKRKSEMYLNPFTKIKKYGLQNLCGNRSRNNDDEYFFCEMRENLYDVFIYNLNPYECVWIILNKLIFLKKIKSDQMTDILIKTHVFLQYYNNNYRPIYHFENFIMFLTMNVLEGENHII